MTKHGNLLMHTLYWPHWTWKLATNGCPPIKKSGGQGGDKKRNNHRPAQSSKNWKIVQFIFTFFVKSHNIHTFINVVIWRKNVMVNYTSPKLYFLLLFLSTILACSSHHKISTVPVNYFTIGPVWKWFLPTKTRFFKELSKSN